jgi:hypothetical protein
MTIPKISLHKSNIEQQHRPILDQPPADRIYDRDRERFTLEARPRSIYMMSGPSREVWEHSIPAVEAQHYSITFGTMAAKS